jgi:hypothetical protein
MAAGPSCGRRSRDDRGAASSFGGNAESAGRFHQHAEQFRGLLQQWSVSPAARRGSDLRVAFYGLSSEAERLEGEMRAQLDAALVSGRVTYTLARSAWQRCCS